MKDRADKNTIKMVGNDISHPILSPADRRRKEFYGTISLWLPEREQLVVENVVSCSSSSLFSPPSPSSSLVDEQQNKNCRRKMDKRVLSSTTSLYPFIPVPDISPSYVSKSNGDIRNNNLIGQSNLPFDPKNFENTNNTTTTYPLHHRHRHGPQLFYKTKIF